MSALVEWLRSGEHLPEFMRDFHAQKRIFKRIEENARPETKLENITYVNWINAHIYVIDSFLLFMARRGYTLQRSRKDLEFIDLEKDLEDFDRREIERESALLKAYISPSAERANEHYAAE